MVCLITILAGGTGSVKLLRGVARLENDQTIVSNVGDNFWYYGLYVCPDIDTIVYGLAGILDKKKGWGIKGDRFSFISQMKKMGIPAWFGLGDRDLATHVYRTEMLRHGKQLTEITDSIAKMFNIKAKILPATNDEVTTFMLTPRGQMHLQEFWVKHGARLGVNGVTFRGADKAKPTRYVVKAIKESERIIIAPANPVSSIGPMLAIAGLRHELVRARDKVIAVSPIIGGHPVSGPAAKYMNAVGLEVSPIGLAAYYKDVIGSLVISKTDWKIASKVKEFGIQVLKTNILMTRHADEVRLANYLTGKIWN